MILYGIIQRTFCPMQLYGRIQAPHPTAGDLGSEGGRLGLQGRVTM